MRILITSFIIIASVLIYAQKDIPFEKQYFPNKKEGLKEAKKNIKEGDNLYMYGASMMPQAISFYESANAFNPNNAQLNYRLGNCYINSINKYKALEFYQKALKLNSTIAQDIHLQIGKGLHLKYEFDKALKEYEAYRNVLNHKIDQEKILNVGRFIEQCKYGKKMMETPERVWIDNLGKNINTYYPEYSPMITADESVIIFTTRRENGIGNEKDVSDMGYMEDIFVSFKDVNGSWSPATGLDENINTDSHDATSGFSNDGLTIFVYYGHKGMGDIYVSEKVDGLWTKAKSIGKKINTKTTHETSACLSFDGKQLYFSSDRPGGFGGHDIWVSNWNKEKEQWGEAKNLGGVVNTSYDERGVFMHPDGKTMYFSSDGHKGMGGYDIYSSMMDDNKIFLTPVNIGYPISTPDDDVHFVMAANGKHGYYSSYHEDGEGEKDIYMVTFLGQKKEPILSGEDNLLSGIVSTQQEDIVQPKVEVNMKNLAIFKGKVLDADTKQPVSSQIELVDNGSSELVSEFKNDGKSGKFILSLPAGKNYGIAVKAEGYLFHSENFDIPESAGFREYEKIIYLQKLKKDVSIVLRNIFFDLNKYSLKAASKIELNRLIELLETNPDLRIEISGHTDSRGSDSHNQKLSQDRAKAVVDYLVGPGGFSRSRFEFKGYGETKPLISKEDINKLKSEEDKEEAHSKNRRTEFKIVD